MLIGLYRAECKWLLPPLWRSWHLLRPNLPSDVVQDKLTVHLFSATIKARMVSQISIKRRNLLKQCGIKLTFIWRVDWGPICPQTMFKTNLQSSSFQHQARLDWLDKYQLKWEKLICFIWPTFDIFYEHYLGCGQNKRNTQ